MKRFTAIAFLLLAPCARGATPAIYYVSTNGLDSNPGTKSRPWLTIQKGLNAVAAGDTLIVTAGDYYGTNQTVLDGASGSPITVQGQPGTWLRW